MFSSDAWKDSLIAKFPDFDEAWSDEIKTKWMETYAHLVDKLVDA